MLILSSLFLLDRLLRPDHLPFHHPRLLHLPYRQPAEEEDGWGKGQTEASGVGGPVRCGGLLHLLPAQHLCPCRVDCGEAEGVAAGGGHRGPGLRQPHGPVVQRLPAGPVGLLLLQLGVQRCLRRHLLPKVHPEETADVQLWSTRGHHHHNNNINNLWGKDCGGPDVTKVTCHLVMV